MPAIDAPFIGGAAPLTEPALDVSADWEHVQRARTIVDRVGRDITADAKVKRILNRLPPGNVERELEVLYAVVDIVMAAELSIPVLCSTGRQELISRLIELRVVDEALSPEQATKLARITVGGTHLAQTLSAYVNVTGLAFTSDTVSKLGRIKSNNTVRAYANGFQRQLEGPKGAVSPQEFFERIRQAQAAAKAEAGIATAFTTVSRALSWSSLIPAVGTPAAIGGLVADAGTEAARRREESLKWYELAPEIQYLKSIEALEEALGNDQ